MGTIPVPELKIGNTVIFARGRYSRRGAPLLGVVQDVLNKDWVRVISDRGSFKVRRKDCIALLSFNIGVNEVKGEKL